METIAQISTAELIDIVTESERCENQLHEIRRIIEEAEAFRRQQEAGKLKTVSVPEYMGTGECERQQEE